MIRFLSRVALVGFVAGFVPTYVAAQNDQLPAAVCAELTAQRKQYPQSGLSKAQIGKLLNDTALTFATAGYGLLGKRSGNNCPLPDGRKVSCDFLVLKSNGVFMGWDVLIDEEGSARVTCGRADQTIPGQIASGNRTYEKPVGAVIPEPPPDPPTCPEPDPCPPDLSADLQKAREQLATMTADRDAWKQGAEEYHARLVECLNKPQPREVCKRIVFGLFKTCHIEYGQ